MDELIALRVEGEELKRRLWAWERRVMDAIANYEANHATHEYAPAPHVAPFCQSDDEPPSRPA